MNRTRFRSAWIEFISGQNFTHFATLHWNAGEMQIDAMHRDLKAVHRRVDKARLGRRFWRKPTDVRSTAMFFVEKLSTSAHCHSFWKAPISPGGMPLEAFLTEASWRAIAPAGSILIEPIRQVEPAANYSLKEQHVWSDDRSIIFSENF